MKKMVGLLVIGALGALLIGGCATENVVKKDEVAAPTAAAQAPQTSEKSPKSAPAVAATPVKKSPENAATDASKPGVQTREQLKSALDKIYFNFDSFTLSEQARKTLAGNADYLQKNVAAKLRIEGNCDERGSAEYNLALGDKRAKTAMKYLAAMGIAEDRLGTISYGKEKPADAGHDETAWEKNRRDDFVIVSK